MNKWKMILSISVAFLATGCATRYNGPGTFQDFAKARYQCVLETSARVSGAAVTQYGAAASSRVMPSCSAFAACLAAKGYFEAVDGRFDASSIAVECKF